MSLMSVRRALGLLLLSTTLSARARAEAPCADGESDCEKQSSAAETDAAPRVVNASGLVPLRELNSRPYSGVWFYDFRFHALELGFSVTSLAVSGEIAAAGQQGVPMTVPVSDSAANFIGIVGNYYLPLVGYSPNVSVGLVPELHLQLGGVASGSTNNYTDDLSETKLGSSLQLPLFAMLRAGKHALRYSDWNISLGAGIGVTLLRFNTGQPVSDRGSYLAPALRAEAGYGGIKIGYEITIGSHDNFDSSSAPVRLAYRAQTLTVTLLFSPDPED